MTPLQAWDRAVAEIVEWAIYQAQGLSDYRRNQPSTR